MKSKLLLLTPALLAMLLSSCGTSPSDPAGSSSSGANVDPAAAVLVKSARSNTVEADQYEYDFNVTAKIKFKGALNFSPATYSGTTYVNNNATTTQFMQVRNLSGALVIDSTNYVYNVGTDLVKISADEDKDFSVINHETVESTYDFDKYNFGHILKTLNDDGFVKVDYNSNENRYDLSLKTNFSQDSLLSVLNYIDSQTILKALSGYTKDRWGVDFEVNTWATLDSAQEHLAKFHFDANVNIKDTFEIQFEFEQDFKKYNNVNIVMPTFSNTIIEEDDVKAELDNIKDAFEATKAANTSYYTYDVKTTVDHGISRSNPLGLAVNSRTQGYAKRQIIGDVVYFNNRLEVDSDYKNNDQLGNLVADYDSYRAKLNDSNKTVYDVLDPKVGFNQYTELTDYDEEGIDNYYMLPNEALFSFNNFKVVKKSTDNDSNTTYKLGMSCDTVKGILEAYNDNFRVDYTRVTLFDIYKVNSGFNAKKAYFTVKVSPENKLLSVDIDLKGFYVEEESEDQVKYRLEVDIDYNWSKSYTAVSNRNDIDNN